jgi:hypothetical protein
MSAYDFEVDGVYYDQINPNSVGITYKDASFNSYSGDVVIPDTITVNGNNYKVSCVKKNAFRGSTGLTSVILPSTVDNIQENAFRGCENLTTVEYTSLIGSLGRCAFWGCKSLESIHIPGFIEELTDSLFYGCESLTTISIPNHKYLKTIGNNVFNGCIGLTSVSLPYKAETYGDGVFRDCTSLTQVTLRDNVQSIGAAMFYGCTNLTQVTIPNSVKNLSAYTFYHCDNLTTVTLSDSLESVGEDAFYYCKALTQLTLPNTVKTIGREAFGESGLTSFVIPDSVETIENNTFINCYHLYDIVYSPVLKTIGSQAFLGSGLSEANIPNTVTKIGGSAFAYCQRLTSIHISESVTTLEQMAFADTYITDVIIPSSVTKIGHNVFSRCLRLTNVFIPSSVTSMMSSAFNECRALSTIVVEAGNPVYDSRDNCNAIIVTATNTLVKGGNQTVIPNTVTSIASGAFKWSSLSNIDIPGSVTSIGYAAFEGCYNLSEVNIGKSVTELSTGIFEHCVRLTSLNVDPENPVFDSRDSCNAIIETATNTLVYGSCATVIPEGITAIAPQAFLGLKQDYYTDYGLHSINIPSTMTTIGNEAFGGCTGLVTIISRATEPPTLENDNVFAATTYNNAVLNVYESSINAYRTAPVWQNFSQIQPLSEGGEPMEQTASPRRSSFYYSPDYDQVSIRLYNHESEPDATIYYHVAIKPYTIQPVDSTEWTEYTKPIVFTELGQYLLEFYAIAPGKLMSRVVHNDINIDSFDPLPEDADFDFRVDGIHYKILSDSTVGVCARYRENHYDDHFVQYHMPSYSGDIVIPETVTWDDITYTVTTILEDAFWNCELTSISLPNTLTDIDEYSFYSCQLPKLDIPNSVINIGKEAFYYSSLPSVTIPASVEHLGKYAFAWVETLKVDPNNPVYDSRDNCNAVIETATNTLVMGCRYGKIPYGVEAIGDSVYADLEYFNENNYMAIPGSVTRIGKKAVNSMGLNCLRIGASVEFIDTAAFYCCFGLWSITCHSTTPPEAYDAFLCENYSEGMQTPYEYATLYVPEGSLQAYRNHEEWGRFASILEFDEDDCYDVNGDGEVNISDATYIINLLSNGEWLPDYADVNGDGLINITDIVALINYLINN